MERKVKRIVLYASDIQKITGRSERTVRRWIVEIKKKTKPKKNRLITVEEFCDFMDYDPIKVREYLD